MTLAFASKARTLQALAGTLATACVPPLAIVAAGDWQDRRAATLDALLSHGWAAGPLAVRSSAAGEDGAHASQAGAYRSHLNVSGRAALAAAIDDVLASYARDGRALNPSDEILVQAMVDRVAAAGAAFGRDPTTAAPYAVISWSTDSSTDTVTSGRAGAIHTYVHHRGGSRPAPPTAAAILALLGELETRFGTDRIDIEFAIDTAGTVHLLQARPLVPAGGAVDDDARHRDLVAAVADKLRQSMAPHPYLRGRRGVFGVMPDWNPAEIIGLRPKPLALSLYRELVTDSIWAYQRHNYGYRNLRSFPLLLNFGGLPYVDVRVSFNSFVPAALDDHLADRLVNHYVDRLIAEPVLHDKVEFEIVYSCYTLDLPQRLGTLTDAGFTAEDRTDLADALRSLTNRVIARETGLWRNDLAKLDELERRRRAILSSDLDTVAKIYWLLEDCKRYGTLPFAGLARAGFMAVQLLRSMVAMGVLSEADYARFIASLDTVSGRMAHDLAHLPRAAFLAEYGHLRPGTYDILSPRYDAAPDKYFAAQMPPPPAPAEPFSLPLPALRRMERLLSEHGLDQDVIGLFDFIEAGIVGREQAKFVFTRSLSQALESIADLGAGIGLSRADMAYVDYADIRALHGDTAAVDASLRAASERGRTRHQAALGLYLPPLIVDPDDAWGFYTGQAEPNFITLGRAEGPAAAADPESDLTGRIVLIDSADPGYDWLFTRGIAGFVTAFGGANSHMAIRAGELAIPAAIGVGEQRLNDLRRAGRLELDCANARISALA